MRPFSAPALSSPESKSGCLAAKRAAISFDVCFHPGRALHLRGRQRGDTNGLKDLGPPEDGVLFPAELLQLAGGSAYTGSPAQTRHCVKLRRRAFSTPLPPFSTSSYHIPCYRVYGINRKDSIWYLASVNTPLSSPLPRQYDKQSFSKRQCTQALTTLTFTQSATSSFFIIWKQHISKRGFPKHRSHGWHKGRIVRLFVG